MPKTPQNPSLVFSFDPAVKIFGDSAVSDYLLKYLKAINHNRNTAPTSGNTALIARITAAWCGTPNPARGDGGASSAGGQGPPRAGMYTPQLAIHHITV
jgi:hypothetical protein